MVPAPEDRLQVAGREPFQRREARAQHELLVGDAVREQLGSPVEHVAGLAEEARAPVAAHPRQGRLDARVGELDAGEPRGDLLEHARQLRPGRHLGEAHEPRARPVLPAERAQARHLLARALGDVSRGARELELGEELREALASGGVVARAGPERQRDRHPRGLGDVQRAHLEAVVEPPGLGDGAVRARDRALRGTGARPCGGGEREAEGGGGEEVGSARAVHACSRGSGRGR